MGWLNLLFGINRGSPALERDREVIEQEAALFARDATDNTVTKAALANHNGRSNLPLIAYFEEDERPHFIFRGGVLFISDEDGSLMRNHPTRETQVIVSDQRLLFVVGSRRSDDVWGVEFKDVMEAYLDTESWRQYLVVDTDSNGDELTFFADLTLDQNDESLRDALAYLRNRCRNLSENL